MNDPKLADDIMKLIKADPEPIANGMTACTLVMGFLLSRVPVDNTDKIIKHVGLELRRLVKEARKLREQRKEQ